MLRSVSTGKRRWLTIVGALVTMLTISGSATTSGEGRPLGPFDSHEDIGGPKIAGSAVYNPVSQEYSLSAGGVNMWAQRDEFHFVWKRMTGDFILQARVEFLGKGVEPHRKAGWMVRPSLDTDAPYVDGVVHGEGLTSLQFRRTKGAITAQTELATKGPDVIQLERKGGKYIFSAAKYGEPFTSAEIADIDLGDQVYVGLALCSHNPDVTERAIFRDVRIIRPAKDTFVPYRDFIGSVLEILDVETGHRQIVYRSEQPFEAPNWTADGSALIYNRSGRGEGWGGLYRFDLATRQSTLIDTGVANRNNNDHVLSFDGAMLGISDQSQASGGRSTVYTVPVTGGTPKRITHAVAVLPSQLVARRQVSDLHRRPQRRVRHLSHPGRRQRSGGEAHRLHGAGRRAGVHAGRTPHLLQLRPERHDADLAHGSGWPQSRAGHQRRLQQLVSAHLAGRPVDRDDQLSEGRPAGRSPVLQARVPALDADCRRRRRKSSRMSMADRGRSTCRRGHLTAG